MHVIPVLLNDKALQHSRVFVIHGCPQRPYVGFTQSQGRSYGGIVPVFVEFTGPNSTVIDNTRHD